MFSVAFWDRCSGFLLLPLMRERWVLFVFSLPWLLMGIRPDWFSKRSSCASTGKPAFLSVVAAGVSRWSFTQRDYEDQLAAVRYCATTQQPSSPREKAETSDLLVNGVGITGLTPITKFMAHLPLAFLDHPPQERLGGVFRHGHNLPFTAFVGHSGNRGGVGA